MDDAAKPVGQSATEMTAPGPNPKKRSSWLPVVVMLLVGFVAIWLKAGRPVGELFRAQRGIRVRQIQMTFANAALDGRRGDYEVARQGAAKVFSLIRAELDRRIGSALPRGAVESLKPLLAQRDDPIPLLARGNPASAERLATAYAEFRKTLGR